MIYRFSNSTVRYLASAPRIILLLVSLCAAVTPASAVNIYDVVQLSRAGYGDDEIIVIIGATESVFELTSEDIVGLENLGISSPVINAMMNQSALSDQHDTGPTIKLFESSPESSGRAATHETETIDENYATRPLPVRPTPPATGSRSDTYAAPTPTAG